MKQHQTVKQSQTEPTNEATVCSDWTLSCSFQKVHMGNVSPMLSYGWQTIISDKVCDIYRDPGTGVIREVILELKDWVNYN